NPAHLDHLGWAADDPRVVRLRNPLASDRSILRPTLLFGLLEALQLNVRRQSSDVRLFEIGRIFEARGPGALPHEDTRIGVVLSGLRAPRSWFVDRARVDLFDAKGAVESLVTALGRDEVRVEPTDVPFLEAGRAGSVLVDGTVVGRLGELRQE